MNNDHKLGYHKLEANKKHELCRAFDREPELRLRQGVCA